MIEPTAGLSVAALMYYADDTSKNLIDTFNEMVDKWGSDVYEDAIISSLSQGNYSDFKSTMDSYAELIYSVVSLDEFAASSIKFGTEYIPADGSRLPGLQSLAKYSSRMRMPLSIASIMNKAFQLVKDMITAIVGDKNANQILEDVLYLSTLSKMSKFVKPGTTKEADYVPSSLASEITKTCK